MDQTPRLLIFDVDGTLTDSAGITRTAYETVVEELYGVRNSTRGLKPAGRTDRDIFFEILNLNQIEVTDQNEEFRKFSDLYIPLLGRLLTESKKPRLLAGVKTLLEKLAALEPMHLALGTGNIEQSAYLKLHRHNVSSYFPVGGFGSDSSVRAEIIAIALRRAQHYYRVPFATRDTWVIGDTPFDIQAGRDAGANTLAVATGPHDQYELARYKPTALFSDLDDWDHFIHVITGKIRFNVEGLVRESQPNLRLESGIPLPSK
ncbi:MAG: HAD hydrolase-like protein [Calditrichota bacterium]